jgi:4-hydroxy-tetrahydrodipicolinate reductase
LGEAVRVVVLGTGQMGSRIADLLGEKEGLALCAAWSRRSGEKLGAFLEEARPAVAIQATCSHLAEAEAEITPCLARGIHVVSIAEEMALPAASSPACAARLDALAREHGAVALGTGVNPGFVLDTLIVTLTGVCAQVTAIHARRANDLAPYGPTVLRSQGVGLSPEAFRAGVEDGTVVGHVGFPQSIGMIASSLGWALDRVLETREPIVSGVRRETPHVVVEPGQVAGCQHGAVGWVDGRRAITLEHPQQVRPEAEGGTTEDVIEIRGRPEVRLSGSPEIPGGEATAALAVNVVPRVLAAAPGLRSMLDLPPASSLPGRNSRV